MNEEVTTKIIGEMDNTIDHTFESANRVYDVEGIAPTINTCGGGGLEPKIIDDLYKNRELRVYNDYSPSLRSERTGLKVVEDSDKKEAISTNGTDIINTIRATYYKNGERNIMKNIENDQGYEGVIIKEDPQVLTLKRTEYGKQIRKDYENHNIYEHRANMTELRPREDGILNTLTSVQKDNYILENNYSCASRGRNPDNPSDRRAGIETEQRLEIHDDGISNCLTSVQKDSLVMEEMNSNAVTREELIKHYKIRKLTPKECWRLMGFSDDDYNKAKQKKEKSYVVGGYNFKTQEEAEMAKDEMAAIKYLSSKTDSKDPKQVFILYNKIINCYFNNLMFYIHK